MRHGESDGRAPTHRRFGAGPGPASAGAAGRRGAGGSPADADAATVFLRGLAVGALVGAAIAGSRLWQGRLRRPSSSGRWLRRIRPPED